MSPLDFWQAVYIAAVRAGWGSQTANANANAALDSYVEKLHAPVVTK